VFAQQPPPATQPQQAPAPQVVALHYKVRMERPQGVTTFEAWAGAQSAKSVVRETTDRGFRPGLVMVVTGDGELRQLANPERGEYFELTKTQQREMANRGMAGVSFGLFTTKETVNEPGEKVLGMETQHHRVETAGTFTQEGAQHTIRAVHDLWMTRAVTLPNPKLEMLFVQSASGIPAVDAGMSFTELGGMPVRRTTLIEIDGKSVGKSDYELLSVETVHVPQKDLELPPGLKQVQLPSR
jgi:hypothetical protein